MILTAFAEPLTGFTTLWEELIALEKPLAVFISLSPDMFHNPLWGVNWACRTSTSFHELCLDANCT